MYEAVFGVAGRGPYERTTRGTDTRIELWCNDHCDLLCVSGDADGRVRTRIQETVAPRLGVSSFFMI